MATDGKKGAASYNDEEARAGDPCVLRAGKAKADQGELPVGLICTKNASDELIPYEEVADEVLGTGNGSVAAFSGTLAKTPVEPGSVVVSDGVENFSDDGLGRLTGDDGGSGTVNYTTGAVAVEFDANVGNGTDVEVDYVTKIDGVLNETVDTTKTTSALYIAWGLASQPALKVGASAPAAPDATLLARMEKNGLFPA